MNKAKKDVTAPGGFPYTDDGLYHGYLTDPVEFGHIINLSVRAYDKLKWKTDEHGEKLRKEGAEQTLLTLMGYGFWHGLRATKAHITDELAFIDVLHMYYGEAVKEKLKAVNPDESSYDYVQLFMKVLKHCETMIPPRNEFIKPETIDKVLEK